MIERPCLLLADSVEKVGSRSLKEIRLNDDAIFDLICVRPEIDYGRLGLTRSIAMRSPASFSKNSAYGAEKFLHCRSTDFFNRIGQEQTWARASGLNATVESEVGFPLGSRRVNLCDAHRDRRRSNHR